jgi:4-amino-4-deoxy-L-arabinose transferase-like glycosyltransferase
MLVAWAAMALALLQKGLVGVVFPAGTLACWCMLRRDFTPLARLEWRRGVPLFLAIAAPWFIAVSVANPEFARFFFIHEHFERFLTTGHRRVQPWWYFLPILAVGFLPWMFALPSALRHAWKLEGDVRAAAELRLAMLGALLVVAFFSASGSKLPAYILPAFPMLALVLGRYLAEAPTRKLALQVMPIMLVGAALFVPALNFADRQTEPWTHALHAKAQPWAIAATVVLFAVGAFTSWALWRGRRWLALVIAAMGMVFFLDCVEDGYEEVSPRQSGKEVAAVMAAASGPDTRLYSVRYFEHTVPFYLGRTLTLVDYADEFEHGLKTEPALRIPDLASFGADWQRPGGALAIMNPATYVRLREQALPMQALHEDPRRVLVRKP